MEFESWPGGAWRQLRATRWEPPGAAATDDQRRRTYVPALDQAEQMFRAAAAAGPSTRPLLLFYGLSQAGRAIAAAATKIRTDDGWQLLGHGIHSVAQTMRGPLADIKVASDRAGGTGSFIRLSELLNSPPLPTSPHATLSVLWDLLPENARWPISHVSDSRRTPLQTERLYMSAEAAPRARFPVFDFPPGVHPASRGPASLETYLESFAGLRDHEPIRSGTGISPDARFTPHSDGWGELEMTWQIPDGQTGTPAEWVSFLAARTRSYCGAPTFFPALTTADRDMHPLMAWWAVLHTLSMLARYQPAEWMSHINVNGDRNAVRLERLMELAIGIVPALIAEAIEEVTQ